MISTTNVVFSKYSIKKVYLTDLITCHKFQNMNSINFKQKCAMFFLAVMLFTGSACKKARNEIVDKAVEIKDKIIKGYWSDFEGLTVEVKDNDGFVIDFSTSGLGKDPNIFHPAMPYVKNIVRTGTDSWTADVIKSTYSLGVLKSVTYEPTQINISNDMSGNTIFTLSNGDKNSLTWSPKGPNYIPPISPYTPQPSSCGSNSITTDIGNSASLMSWYNNDYNFVDVPMESSIFRPYFMQDGFCNYKLEGNLNYADKGIAGVSPQRISMTLILSHKPVTNETFKLVNYGMAHSIGIGAGEGAEAPGTGESAILLDGGKESINNSGLVNISVSGGVITATANNIQLGSNGVAGSTMISFSLMGK